MADEITIQSFLQIQKGTNVYRSSTTQFKTDLVAANLKGPTPGAITVSVSGTNVSLSELTTPGWCRMLNLDGTNYVEWGIWDGVTFYPLGEMLAGEVAGPFRLSRVLGQEFGTGTGTTGAAINSLRLKADTAACDVLVEVFEK